MMERTYTNPAIHKAFNVLDRLSAHEEAEQLAQLREKAMRDEAMFIEKARREAREEGKKEGMTRVQLNGKVGFEGYFIFKNQAITIKPQAFIAC